MLHGGLVCLLILSAIILKSLYQLFRIFIYGKHGDMSATLIAIFFLQIAVNYIGFIILNHNSVDMFIFLLALFIADSQKPARHPVELRGRFKR